MDNIHLYQSLLLAPDPVGRRVCPLVPVMLMLAATGCTQPAGDAPPDRLPAESHALWAETPAAMAILQERLNEKRQQLSDTDRQLQTRARAVGEADQQLAQLEATIRQADQQRQQLDEATRALGGGLEQLRRDQATLRRSLEAQRQEQHELSSRRAPEGEMPVQFKAQPQQPESAPPAEAVSDRSPSEPAPRAASASSVRHQRRAEVRRFLHEDAGLSGFRLHEIDDFSRPSAAVMRRAMASGRYLVLTRDCPQTSHRVEIRVWADAYSRIAYYTSRRIGRPS